MTETRNYNAINQLIQIAANLWTGEQFIENYNFSRDPE